MRELQGPARSQRGGFWEHLNMRGEGWREAVLHALVPASLGIVAMPARIHRLIFPGDSWKRKRSKFSGWLSYLLEMGSRGLLLWFVGSHCALRGQWYALVLAMDAKVLEH